MFTTRCDTLFGATYCVMSPEHKLVDLITSSEKMDEVLKYKSECATKSELERTELNKEKTGVFTGAYAVNPVNGKEIPIYISDYVLSNDEVIDGKSERGGYPVVRKNMKQWVIDQPAFAEKLLEGLEEIDFPESTKEMQRNWIGKSVGAHVVFKVANTDYKFTVFTTRCDTLFGATYCVMSPEHELVDLITSPDKMEEVKSYKAVFATKSDLERTELN